MKISEVDLRALNQIAFNGSHNILLIDNLGVVCATISFHDTVEFTENEVMINKSCLTYSVWEIEKIQVIYRTVNLS